VSQLRLFAVGGYLSYRALFGWLSPLLYTCVLLVPSITQLVFFVYLGRAAGVESTRFYLIGNALVAAAAPGIFATSQTIADERYTHTLALLVVSPANRIALFLGRAAPVIANGIILSAWVFTVGALLFRIHIPAAALPGLALTIAITAYACVGLGLLNASLALRWRESSVLSNFLLYVLLILAGINVPLDRLPHWLSTLAQGLPVTHGAKAARQLAAGASLHHVGGLIAAEALVGTSYVLLGLITIRYFETEARKGAALEVA
jgi:ABC-2 type transport system permease protein